ncbi:HTH domain-containing protein [Rhodobacter sp. KR11]|uniref:helix-turn-helix transcriptional regulator n=1 Tax=Rhodobacter sp. KR11 TaxID=2974588 RepID=UPI002222E2A1|nr:HTH domain-containing protein [Rhodobacter sp. KR11]MCW1919501.1 HTH domain-containing protein [Rhodobacter sp. KR11]
MPRSDRLFDLIQLLRDGRLHRAGDLGAALGVSVRTIWRDMGVLSASGLSIEGERGVGYILRQPITLPPMMLQASEMLALREGLALVAEGGGDLAGAARSLAGKLAGLAPGPRDEGEDIFATRPDAASRSQRGGPQLPVIRKAIRLREVLTVAVLEGGQLRERDIRPLALLLEGSWVLAAWVEGQGFAALGLDQVLDVVPRGVTFGREAGRRLADWRKWRAGALGET